MNVNHDIAGRLNEVAEILAEQGASRFRVQAYQRAAATLRNLDRPVAEIFNSEGIDGLEQIPGIGTSIARSIRDILLHGRLAMLDRLRGEHDPIAVLMSVPGVGKSLAGKLHDELDIDSLEDLETAAHDGRLAAVAGLGEKRLAGIRDSLAHRLNRVAVNPPIRQVRNAEPSVAELLDVDREYRQEADAGNLKTIAPRRFNPTGEPWLPVLHTRRGDRHYTALFSNTARAHEMKKTRDWVVIYCDGAQAEERWTIITSLFGRLKGKRIVRGREDECAAFYEANAGVIAA